MLYSKLKQNGYPDDIIAASGIFLLKPAEFKDITEFMAFFGGNVDTATEEIATFKNSEDFKRFQKTEEMVHLFLLARDNNFGYDDAKFAGIFNSSDMLLTRTSVSRRAASGLPIEFNYSFVINSQNHQNKVLVAMPFLDNIDTLIKLYYDIQGLKIIPYKGHYKICLMKFISYTHANIRSNVLTDLLLDKFMPVGDNRPAASRLLYYQTG